MLKHRGFPGRLPGTDFQFVIRRANKAGATAIIARPRYADRGRLDRRADTAFLAALWEHFGEEPFARGNLDAGRLSWLFGREVVPAEQRFDPCDYEALLRIDLPVARRSYPEVFEDNASRAGAWDPDLDGDLDAGREDDHGPDGGAEDDRPAHGGLGRPPGRRGRG